MIRSGEEKDLDSIVNMAEEFWKHTIYDEPFCDESVKKMALMCMSQGLLSVLEIAGKVVGFACGLKGALLGNNSVTSGSELAWWVDEDHRQGKNGIALLRHIEGLAKDAGIKHWNMAYMESSMPESIKTIYERMGYTKTEIIYSRVL